MSNPQVRTPTTLRFAGLAGLAAASAMLATGCENKPGRQRAAETATGTSAGGRPNAPGVTATEIKIGQSMPYSGGASAYGVIGKGAARYFKMINDKGGINGRKLDLISLDDSYSPPKAIENVRKLVEGDGVAFIFNNLGTATNTAVRQYLNDHKVPQLFVASGADKWADPEHFPWTIGFQPSYRTEAKVLARYLMQDKPAAKLCVLYQNDDFGKDYLVGLRDGLGDKYDKTVVKTASYEPTDPTIDSQIVSLQAAGCDALLTAATPKYATQTIRRIFDLGWKPFHMLTGSSLSRSAVLGPAGLDKSTGIVAAGYIKDITDPALANDPGLNQYRAFAKEYLADLDQNDGNLVYSFGVSMALVKVLTQCGDDLSRENIVKQAANLTKLQLPVIVDGIAITTTPTDYRVYSDLQLARFNGNNFESMGITISAE